MTHDCTQRQFNVYTILHNVSTLIRPQVTIFLTMIITAHCQSQDLHLDILVQQILEIAPTLIGNELDLGAGPNPMPSADFFC